MFRFFANPGIQVIDKITGNLDPEVAGCGRRRNNLENTGLVFSRQLGNFSFGLGCIIDFYIKIDYVFDSDFFFKFHDNRL